MSVVFLRIEIQNISPVTLRFLSRNPASFAVIKPSSPLASLYSTVSSQIEQQSNSIYEYHNVATCIATLQQCAQRNDAVSGEQVHGFMVRKGFLEDSPRAVTSLVNMYAKCDLMRQAISVFGGSERDVFGYNAVISGFVVNGSPLDAMKMYREMRAKGVFPDKYTFPSLLKGSDVMEISDVKKIHGLVFKHGFDSDCYVGSGLVTSYLKFMLMKDAQKVFDELPERDDIVLWNALVNGYSRIFRFEDALVVFSKMREEGVAMSRHTVTGVLSAFTVLGDLDNGRSIHGLAVKLGFDSGVVVSNALIDMYGKSKWLEEAIKIFGAMDQRDIFTWNSFLCVHDYCGDHDGTLALFERMLCSGIRPDLVTLTTVLPTCGRLAALKQGREIHGYMIVNGLLNRNSNDEFVNNSLMDMYAKCGGLRNAQTVFDSMRNRDSASWNIMINGYGVQSCGELALDMFTRMCSAGVKPDEITFVGLLQACNHSGFVSQGRRFLEQMETVYNIVPTSDHYTCVIDMLGRAGKLEEAYELAIAMPMGDDNPVVWRSILSSCRLHGNTDLAKVAGKRLYELEPEHCGGYILLSNVYVEAGKYEEVMDVRDTMRQQKVKKTPGGSWIGFKKDVRTFFFTGDQSHPEFKSIKALLYMFTSHIRGNEYLLLDD